MKRRVIFTAVFVGSAFFLFSLIGVARGQNFQTGTSVNVPKTQTIDGSFYSAGRTVDIAGTINGDLFCAGQNITVSGTGGGDIFWAGQNVHISGRMDGDIRTAGQNVTFSASVGHNVTSAGQSITLESGAKVAGDLTAAGNDLNTNGSVVTTPSRKRETNSRKMNKNAILFFTNFTQTVILVSETHPGSKILDIPLGAHAPE